MNKIITILSVLLIQLQAATCDTNSYTNFVAYGQNKTLALTKSSLTWQNAKTLAEESGGMIWTPLSNDENSFGVSNFPGSFWIGVYDPNYTQSLCLTPPCQAEPNRFISLNGSTYRNWSPEQPNNHAPDINAQTPLGNHFAFSQNGVWYADKIAVTRQAIVEFNGQLDCIKPTSDPNTTPNTEYYCTSADFSYAKCKCKSNETWNSNNGKCESGGTITYTSIATTTSYAASYQQLCSTYFNCPSPLSINGNLYWYMLTTGSQCWYSAGEDGIYTKNAYDTTCSSAYTCPSGGTLSGTTCTTTVYKCNAGDTPTTTSFSPFTCIHNTLVQTTPSSCPLGNYVCKSAADTSNTQNTDTTQGATDKQNNGQTDSSGNCLGSIYIFNGKDMRCRKQDAFGLSGSCCNKDSVLAGFIQCKPEEKNWAKLVDQKKGHKVGEYCSKKFLGMCQAKKETWCTFSSQLARIIHEQGRPQLGISWGSPESPNCRGLTPNEFQKLDFSKIDMSEFVAELSSKLSTSTFTNNITSTMTQKMTTFQKVITGK